MIATSYCSFSAAISRASIDVPGSVAVPVGHLLQILGGSVVERVMGGFLLFLLKMPDSALVDLDLVVPLTALCEE